jgi:hypothetical protein
MRGFLAAALAFSILGSVAELPAQQVEATKVSVSLAGEPWALAFNVKDFEVKTNELQPDGRAYLVAENQITNVTLSVYL